MITSKNVMLEVHKKQNIFEYSLNCKTFAYQTWPINRYSKQKSIITEISMYNKIS